MRCCLLLLAFCRPLTARPVEQDTPPSARKKPQVIPVEKAAEVSYVAWPPSLSANAAFLRVTASEPSDAEVRLVRDEMTISSAIFNGTEAVLWGPFRDCDDMLCLDMQYEVVVDEPILTFTPSPPPPDLPQWIGEGRLVVSDTSARIERQVTRGCVLSGLDAPFTWTGAHTLPGLSADTTYDYAVICIDDTGLATRPWPLFFTTTAARDVRFTEIVVAPEHDWNDDTPFDATAGSGAVTTADQYVELTNFAAATDITGWSIEVRGPSGGRYTLPLSASLAPGARFVRRLSSTDGSASRTACLSLIDETGAARDSVCLGKDAVPHGSEAEAIALCHGTWVTSAPSPGDDCP